MTTSSSTNFGAKVGEKVGEDNSAELLRARVYECHACLARKLDESASRSASVSVSAMSASANFSRPTPIASASDSFGSHI